MPRFARRDITRCARSDIVRQFASQIMLTVILYSPCNLQRAKRISLAKKYHAFTHITRRKANITEKRQISVEICRFFGWGGKNRTFPARVKVSCPTTRLHPNIHDKHYTIKHFYCQYFLLNFGADQCGFESVPIILYNYLIGLIAILISLRGCN